ncbi:isochorismatase family protein [Evansella sp. LMS18]|uniref:isochorismatase family protein n=1 Tax=Evansella sp. LMS18 TaxID=2924033 RepID=UPI0020D124A2|nr:isochorismatase family protein [Evansella sp. LMS18]UTR12060.1 isochorismatase family protein [Evansella sp. LMS18]
MAMPIDVKKKWEPIMGEKELEGYEKAGMGQRVGWGEKPAILVVDVTRNFVDPEYPQAHGELVKRCVAGNETLLEKARSVGIPLFFVRPKQRTKIEMGIAQDKWGFLADSKTEDPAGYEWPDNIAPREGDSIFEKTRPSSFFETHFRSMLTYLKIDTLIITGISTSGCLRASVVDAFYANYRVIIPEECCGDRSEKAHTFNLFDMDMKFGDVSRLENVLEKLEDYRR